MYTLITICRLKPLDNFYSFFVIMKDQFLIFFHRTRHFFAKNEYFILASLEITSLDFSLADYNKE